MNTSAQQPRVSTTGWKSISLDPHTLGDSIEGGLCGIEELDAKSCQNLNDYGNLPGDLDPTSFPFSKKKSIKKMKKKRIGGRVKKTDVSKTLEKEGDVTSFDVFTDEDLSKAWKDLELHPRLLRAIHKCGFQFPLPIQSYCIPAACKRRKDVLGAAQTGSGKTLAFAIPIFQRLLEEKDNPPPSVLITTPSKQPQQTSLEESQVDEGVPNDVEELVEIGSIDSDGVGYRYEDPDAMCISDKELEVLHESVGTVYYSDLAQRSESEKSLRALILTPTRELALQVYHHLDIIGKETEIRVVPVVGGMAAQKQTRLLGYCPEIVIATPGRFLDLYRQGVPHLSDLRQLKFLVIDECDKMIRHGDFKDLTVILQCIPEYELIDVPFDAKNNKGKKKQVSQPVYRIAAEDRQMQTLLFSATLTLPRSLHRKLRTRPGAKIKDEDVDEMALALDVLRFRGEPEIVDLTPKARLADRIQEAYLLCSEDIVDACLYSLIMKYSGRTLVFCNAIKNPIHAAKQQSQRLKALERFVADSNSVLIATDVAARGLDLPDVRCVIHYNVPKAADLYIHRSGRTARVEADGLALSLEMARFQALFRTLKCKTPPVFPLDQGSIKECTSRVNLAKRIQAIDVKRDLNKKDAAWRQKTAETLQAVSMENSVSSSDEVDEDGLLEKERAVLFQTLSQRLAEPLEKRMDRKYFTGNVLPGETTQRSLTAFKDNLNKARRVQELQKSMKRASKPKSLKHSEAERIRRHQLKLDEILNKKIAKRQKLKSLSTTKQKLVVIPPALGREAQGPDALRVIRDYMQKKERSF